MFDVVVIGAGAAGIAAGRALIRAGVSFLIVEAGDRVGGRAWTRMVEGWPLDLGCGWLHSADRNPWAEAARQAEIAIDRTPPAWGVQFNDLGFSREEQEQAEEAWDRFDRRMRDAPPASDRAADALDPACPWNAYLEARSGYINGAGLGQISIRDYLAYDEADTGVNWRAPDGYGAVIAQAAEALPIRLRCPVARIDRRGPRLRLDTPDGAIEAAKAIVTVPTAALESERLRFDPPLHGKTDAAASLPLGLANKLFLHLDGADDISPDRHLIGDPRRAETGSYYLRPFGRPMIEAFYGGAGAEALEAARPAAMVDFALSELGALFGSAFPRRLRPLACSAWAGEAVIGGSYSHACPGRAGARKRLAEPVEERIFFAGEACSPADFSTAHGAFATGVAAAEAVLAAGYPQLDSFAARPDS